MARRVVKKMSYLKASKRGKVSTKKRRTTSTKKRRTTSNKKRKVSRKKKSSRKKINIMKGGVVKNLIVNKDGKKIFDKYGIIFTIGLIGRERGIYITNDNYGLKTSLDNPYKLTKINEQYITNLDEYKDYLSSLDDDNYSIKLKLNLKSNLRQKIIETLNTLSINNIPITIEIMAPTIAETPL